MVTHHPFFVGLLATSAIVACETVTEPPGPPVSIVPTSEAVVSASVTSPFADSVRVRAVDHGGRGVPGVQVSWSATPGLLVDVSPTVSLTDLWGYARAHVITGHRAGSATVQASIITTSGPATQSFAVEIVPGPVVRIESDVAAITLGRMGQRQLGAAAYDQYDNVAAAVNWTSSNLGVADVTEGGLLTGRTAGLATLTASAGSVQLQVDVMVTEWLLSDNFDDENGGDACESYRTLRHWTVIAGDVDLIGAGSVWDFVPGNGLYLDLDGWYQGATLRSLDSFILAPGTYELSFRLAGSQRGDTNRVRVTLGSLYDETFTLQSADPFTTYVRTLQVNTPLEAQLVFQQEGNDAFGALLDAVRLEAR